MAAVSPQSSRAGLITAVVIFAILTVVGATLSIHYGMEADKNAKMLEIQRLKFADIIADSDLNGSMVNDLKALRQAPGYGPQMKLLEVANKKSEDLAMVITGSTQSQVVDSKTGTSEAAKLAADRLAEAAKVQPSTGTLPKTNNLVGAIDTLANEIRVKNQQLVGVKPVIDHAKAEAEAAIKDKEAAIRNAKAQIEEVNAKAEQEVKKANDDLAAKDTKVKELEEAQDKERKKASEELARVQGQLTASELLVKKTSKEKDALSVRLHSLRPIPVSGIVALQSDGYVIHSSGSGTVYINLGMGDHIAPGLTFEVYGRNEGIPAVEPRNENELPAGKGSIEVIRVGEHESECRVIKQQPGRSIAENDLIANLIYDKNIKPKFVVFGKFDVDQNGQYSSADLDIIKRLITQWGGTLMNEVNVDTDYLVMGKEPVLTQAKPEDEGPLGAAQRLEAEKEYRAYQDILQKARDLHIPILNQNRFLYFVGYYDQAKR